MCRNVTVMALLIAFFAGSTVRAQQYAYQVVFTDKNNSPYSLGSPSAYLSARAIARRGAQSIALDSTDLPVDPAYVDSVLTLTGGILHETSKWLNLCVILLPDQVSIHALDGKPFISSTKLVASYSGYLHHKMSTATGSSATSQPARKNTSTDATYYGLAWDQTDIVNGYFLHDKGYDGTGKLIAVLDQGFTGTDTNPGFDTLRNSGRIIDVHNFTLASDNVYNYDTHGTNVLSTMAGYEPNTYVGTSPAASYALYISEDGNSEQPIELINMLCASERSDSIGADIITTSLGYNTFDNPADNFNFSTDFDGKTTTAAKAANIATQKGILFVATAGNEGGDSWNMILTPGDADSALTIGSVNIYGVNASNSGYGPNAAGRVKPDVCAMGQGAEVFLAIGVGPENGTSFSTPQVAGWAADLWEANPTATPAILRNAIVRCASTYNSPGTQMGYGIANFECTQISLNVKDVTPVFSAGKWVIATPNPFSSELTLSAFPDDDANVNFRIMDMEGKTVSSVNVFLNKGYNAPFSILLSGLPAGIYALRAVSATQQQVLMLRKNP